MTVNRGTLYVNADINVTGILTVTNGGTLCIGDGVFVRLAGSVNILSSSIQPQNTVNFGVGGHMSVTGSFGITRGTINMNNCSMIEVCASYTHNTNSTINYTGDNSCKGYLVVKSTSAGDAVTPLSPSNQIAFVVVSPAAAVNFKLGSAVKCVSQASCPSYWPNGIGTITQCNRSPIAVNYLTTTFLSNIAPVVDLDNSSGGNNYSTTFTEDVSSNLLISNNATVTDTDDANIQSATITLTNELNGAFESISLTAAQISTALSTYGITATTNAAKTLITLTGSATKARYQTVIRQIVYNNTHNNPNTTARTITVVVNDDDDPSNTATTTVSIVRTNDKPIIDLDNSSGGNNYSTNFLQEKMN